MSSIGNGWVKLFSSCPAEKDKHYKPNEEAETEEGAAPARGPQTWSQSLCRGRSTAKLSWAICAALTKISAPFHLHFSQEAAFADPN